MESYYRIANKIVSFCVLSIAMGFGLGYCGIPDASPLVVTIAYVFMLLMVTLAVCVTWSVPTHLVKNNDFRESLEDNADFVSKALSSSMVASFFLIFVSIFFSIEGFSLMTMNTVFSLLVSLSAFIDFKIALNTTKQIKEMTK